VSTTFIAMGIALLAGIGLVVQIGILSLLSGALHFLFARPKLTILKSEKGENGFAFSFKWNSSREPAKFDQFKLRLYNPFGSPTQVIINRDYTAASSTFAQDLDLGNDFAELLSAKGLENASVEIEVISAKGAIVHHFIYKAPKFKDMLAKSTGTADEFNEKNKLNYAKPVYDLPKRSFIAEPLPASSKALKIASNPEFAGEFAGGGGSEAAAVENFSVTKVWIEEGCIVCDACVDINADVFEITGDTCIIKPGAPLDNGISIEEAAEACPVEIIKFAR